MKYYHFDCGCFFPIKENSGLDFDINNINQDCPAVWALLAKGLTTGIFQLETETGKNWVQKLKPTCVMDLCVLGSILRPGTLNSKDENGISLTEHYCRRKNREEEVTYPHPELEQCLKETLGINVFQEQSLEILKILGGFNLVEADLARRGIGKKKADVVEQVHQLFIKKTQEAGKLTLEEAEEIFNLIKASEKYSFNRCCSKDTVISRYHKGKYSLILTVEEMFNIRNDINYAKKTNHLNLYKKWKMLGHYGNGMSMFSDGRIRPNIIKNIYKSGIRPIYRVSLENGSYIDVTNNHKFPTNKGVLTTEQISLESDIKLYFKGKYEITNKNYNFSDLKREEIKLNNKKSVCNSYGRGNYFYTNGSYSLFSKFKKTTENICDLCHETDTRIEVHHKNGDRKNSSFENLQKLCSSCHKKEEYKIGRTKIGQKGYPSLEIKVLSVDYIGEEEVYDVEMDAPNHNFVANDGIVTCNSHAYSYGLITYWTAYLKCHDPLRFFVSKLRHAHYKQDSFEKISDLVLDAKLFNIEVKLPDLTHKKPFFWTDKKVIYYGLTDIKGIGENSYKAILSIIESAEKELGKPLNNFSFLEFCLFCGWDIAEKTTKLINGGALNFFNKTRTEMCYLFDLVKDFTKDVEYPLAKQLYLEKRPKDFIDFFKLAAKNRKDGGIASNVNKVNELLNKLKVLINPTVSLIDTVDAVIWNEEELLGISITHDSNRFDVDTYCKDILNGKVGTVMLGVKIKSIYKNIIKTGNNKGREMAKLSISDNTGNLTALVFADTWDKMKDSVSEGQSILIKGQKQKDNNNFILRELCQTI